MDRHQGRQRRSRLAHAGQPVQRPAALRAPVACRESGQIGQHHRRPLRRPGCGMQRRQPPRPLLRQRIGRRPAGHSADGLQRAFGLAAGRIPGQPGGRKTGHQPPLHHRIQRARQSRLAQSVPDRFTGGFPAPARRR